MKALVEKMQKLNVNTITLDNCLGKVSLVDGHLSYKGGFKRYIQDFYAFEDAFKKLIDNERKLEKWQNIPNFSTSLIYHNDDNTERKETKWSWKSDITDSGISVGEDFVIEGNINQLRKFLSYSNKHLRYCNGCYYKFDNTELTEWMRVFKDFDLYSAYDSFSEYYHNSIVD